MWFEYPAPSWKAPRQWLHYVYAASGVLALFTLSLLLEPTLGVRIPLTAWFLLVMIVSRYGGVGPAVFTAFCGAIASSFLLLQLHGRYPDDSLEHALGVVLYLIGSMGIAILCGSVRKCQLLSKQAKIADRNLREYWVATLNSIVDAAIVTDDSGRVTHINPVAERLSGWSLEEIVGMPLVEFIDITNDKSGQPSELLIPKVLAEDCRIGRTNNAILKTKDRSRIPINVSPTPLKDEEGGIQGAVLVIREITQERSWEHKQEQQQIELERLFLDRTTKLSETEERFRLLVDGTTDYAIYMLDKDGFVDSWNPGAQRIKQYQSNEIIGQHFSLFYTAQDQLDGTPELALRTSKESGRYEEEGWLVRKDGTLFWASSVITALWDTNGFLRGFSKITRDLTELKQAEETARRLHDEEVARKAAELHAQELQKQREQLRVTMESIGDAVVATDADGHIQMLNKIAESLTGWNSEDAIGTPLNDVFVVINEHTRLPIENPAFRAMQQGVIVGLANQTLLISRDGSERAISDSAAPIHDDTGQVIGAVLVFRDVSEQKHLEEQLLQSQKMEAIGILAGGVAHDFNNLLTIILGYCYSLVNDTSLSKEQQIVAMEIEKAGERAASLTHQLLAFSRRQILKPQVTDLNEVISGTVNLLNRLIGENINITTHLAPNLWPGFIDRGQFEQVLMNLAVNARDAMPQGGSIIIETSNATINQLSITLNPELRQGDYVVISFSDTGMGMSDDTKAHIFEPFYTTKERGKGTGLGLSMVFGTIKQSGGQIFVDSQESVGTTFKIYLPKVKPSSKILLESPSSPSTGIGFETVLVVEDEQMLRKLACATLQANGYTVYEACDGNEAQLVFEQSDRIDLLLTDIVMPSLSGRDLAELFRTKNPALKVLYMSGYSDDDALQHRTPKPDVLFIPKPFSPPELTHVVRLALDT